MKLKIVILLLFTHGIIGFLGFATGIYTLPIITAPKAPSAQQIALASKDALYQTEFIKTLKDSDALHWGEGKVSISKSSISLLGTLAPGPDYKLYLSPSFVETEADFKQLKHQMLLVDDINTFDNFIVELDESIMLDNFNTVIVWCESFNQFITSAQYR